MAKTPSVDELIAAGYDERLANEIIEFAKNKDGLKQEIINNFLQNIQQIQDTIVEQMTRFIVSLEQSAGLIAMNAANTNAFNEFSVSMRDALNTPEYTQTLAGFIKGFQSVAKTTQNQFRHQFSEYNDIFSNPDATAFPNAVLRASQIRAAELLSTSTVQTKFLLPLQNFISDAVNTGAPIAKSIKDLRIMAGMGMVSPGARMDRGDIAALYGYDNGKIVQYAKQISYDTMATGDRAYTNAIADEIGAVWFYYAGGELPTTRKFCHDRVGKFYHKKEIESWAKLEWQGKPQNLNEENIFVFLGGYNCQHTLIPVTISRVPPDVVARAIEMGWYNPKEKGAPKQVKEPKPIPVENPPPPPEINPELPPPPSPEPPPPAPLSPSASLEVTPELKQYLKDFDDVLKLQGGEIEFNNQTYNHIGDVFAELKGTYNATTLSGSIDDKKLMDEILVRKRGGTRTLNALREKLAEAEKNGLGIPKMMDLELKRLERSVEYFTVLEKQMNDVRGFIENNVPVYIRPNMQIIGNPNASKYAQPEIVPISDKTKLQIKFESDSGYGAMQSIRNPNGNIPMQIRLSKEKFLEQSQIYGIQVTDASGKDVDFKNYYANHAALTYAHEYGHFYDNMLSETTPASITYKNFNGAKIDITGAKGFFSSEQDNPIMKSLFVKLDSSPEIQFLNKVQMATINKDYAFALKYDLPQSFIGKSGEAYMHYLLSKREIFARAFAQYVATKVGDTELLNTLLKATEGGTIQAVEFARQWKPENFAPIEKEFDLLFEILKAKDEK